MNNTTKHFSYRAIVCCIFIAFNAQAQTDLPVSSTEPSSDKINTETEYHWVEPIFGPEFTFVNWDPYTQTISSANSGTAAHSGYLLRARQHLVESQPELEKFNESANAKFTSPEGWDFTISTDPGVTEVQMAPQTVQFFSEHSSNMQDAIFETAHSANLIASLFQGGGHINIGRNIFEANPLLFRNFLVDFLNHSELSMGILSYDTNNAAPLPLLSDSVQNGIKEAIETFDQNYKEDPSGRLLAYHNLHNSLLRLLVYSNFRVIWPDRNRYIYKHSAISFQGNSPRIEIRSVRPQASFDVWVRQIRLFRNRLLYLSQFKEPIAHELKVKPFSDDILVDAKYVYEPPIDPQLALRAFYEYVTGAGELWQNHRDYLWPAWVYPLNKPIEESELYKFENSDWFKQKEKTEDNPAGCKELISEK